MGLTGMLDLRFARRCLPALITGAAVAAAPGAVDFQREVRPILSDNCFRCHGPDKETRMVNLRLDLREDAMAPRAKGPAVVPGDPAKSLLWQRVNHEKPALRMPPPYSHKTLTGEQKETLRRWIEQGAPWEEHWAYRAPERPAPPAVRNESRVRNPIDRFILARLEAAGLEPAPEADRRTLARRVALDLTGLPPTPEEVETFVEDAAPDAYERLVDRYLASPHYGEHRARYWLDAARYADTHGIHIDNYREMWPYRDWVIQAFNRDMPFDQFTTEQLAGDLLPNPTLEQRVASGFHRCNATTNEAGVIIEEVEAIYAKDRVDTTGAVWLGLTVGCATCHDHKFDPIKQKDFYSLAAFFRNTTQPAMDGNVHDSPPVIPVPSDADRPRWSELAAARDDIRQSMRRIEGSADPGFEAWLAGTERAGIERPLNAGSERVSLRLEAGAPPRAVYGSREKSLDLPAGAALGESELPGVPALRFADKAALALPNLKAIEADRPFSISVWFYFPEGEDRFVVASQNDPKRKSRGWVISVNARVPSLRIVGDEGRGINVAAGHLEQLVPGSWNHLVFTYDGTQSRKGLGVAWNGRLLAGQRRGDENISRLTGSINSGRPLRLAGDARNFLPGGAIADFRVFDRVVTEEEIRLLASWPRAYAARGKPAGALTPEERQALHVYYLNHVHREYRALTARLARIEDERNTIARRSPVTHVMQERTDQQPFAHLLYRGMYDQPRERLAPDIPGILPPMEPGMPRNRLGLAQWLLSPGNPLTARVTVNRYWQEVFGTGLVKTTEDFGSQGEPPSHPELLDWLAVEFRESGWQIKRFFRLMVTSAAYRQSAQASPEKLKIDPDNRLLSRGPRFRMDAEVVRDYSLAASGLLVPTIGGPSVKPYQPEGIWSAVAMPQSDTRHYRPDSGEKLYRRSLYWFWKRSAPPASMEIFNAPTRELCTVRRERTNTPLQALVTMNDPQFVEAARRLAELTLREGGGAGQRFDFMARRLLARPLTAREREVVRAAHRDYLAYYDATPREAKKLVAVGESPADKKLNPAELAAMTMVANQLMNLDEVLNK